MTVHCGAFRIPSTISPVNAQRSGSLSLSLFPFKFPNQDFRKPRTRPHTTHNVLCTTCSKSASEVPLKRCAKCTLTEYCSRECQKQDWKAHEKICGKPGQPGAEGRPFVNSMHSQPHMEGNKSFGQLNQGSWLHGRPEKEVYKLLVDVYRLHADDQYKFEGDADEDGLYGGARDSIEPFRRFLRTLRASLNCCRRGGMRRRPRHALSWDPRVDGPACVRPSRNQILSTIMAAGFFLCRCVCLASLCMGTRPERRAGLVRGSSS